MLDAASPRSRRSQTRRFATVHRAIEGDAQAVWRRRLSLHASDLVRFGRTYRYWRNSLVPTIESRRRSAATQLLALANPQAALDAARDAGTRADRHWPASSASTRWSLEVDSRRIGDETGSSCCTSTSARASRQPTSRSSSRRAASSSPACRSGRSRSSTHGRRHFAWCTGPAMPELAVGDELVVADFSWFSDLKGNKQLPVDRPTPDTVVGAQARLHRRRRYADDPDGHRYCCQPHEAAEAEWSDELAERRARGELNPEVWPPVVDDDAFEVSPAGAPVGDPAAEPAERRARRRHRRRPRLTS